VSRGFVRPGRSDKSPTRPDGFPDSRAGRLAESSEVGQLAAATGADELMITTQVHDHADRRRSYELVAELAH
jgi:hypothetical protein